MRPEIAGLVSYDGSHICMTHCGQPVPEQFWTLHPSGTVTHEIIVPASSTADMPAGDESWPVR